MTLEEMRQRKKERGFTCAMIAEESGIPFSTVQKFFAGSTKAPRKATIDAIAGVLFRDRADRGDGHFRVAQGEGTHEAKAPHSGMLSEDGGTVYDQHALYGGADIAREPVESYNYVRKEPLHTIEDYYALPEERRVELIDGIFYDMPAQGMKHQKIIGDLYILFRECADSHGLPCEVYLSPCDVRLDKDDYTMVQPDLLVICGEFEEGIRYEGAPDLVVEILSPSTRKKDLALKLYKYQNAGVREYWIVDPVFRKVTVHYFEAEDYHPEQYDFDSRIPVNLSGGECEIDFLRVRG